MNDCPIARPVTLPPETSSATWLPRRRRFWGASTAASAGADAWAGATAPSVAAIARLNVMSMGVGPSQRSGRLRR